MKKTLAVVLALLMATTMVFTLVSCGSAEDKVKAYAAEGGKELANVVGDSMTVEARGTEIVFTYKFSNAEYSEGYDDVICEAFDETFTESMIDMMYQEIKKECAEVTGLTIEYLRPDGSVLYSVKS